MGLLRVAPWVPPCRWVAGLAPQAGPNQLRKHLGGIGISDQTILIGTRDVCSTVRHGGFLTKTEYREYIASADWQQRRKDFLNDEGGKCARCEMPRWLVVIAYDQDMHVHHKSYAHLGDEPWEDLEPLCRRCHEIETFGRSELREPPSAICDFCTKIHWNPRANFCETCEVVLGFGSDPVAILEYCMGLHPASNTPIWWDLLRDILDAVRNQGHPADVVLDRMILVEEQHVMFMKGSVS